MNSISLFKLFISYFRGHVAGMVLAFNKKNFSFDDKAFIEFGMEDQQLAKLCANLAANFLVKVKHIDIDFID